MGQADCGISKLCKEHLYLSFSHDLKTWNIRVSSEIVENAAVERCRGGEARLVWGLRHVSHNGGRSRLSGLDLS